MNLNSLMEQLHDIEGLDPISMWPLAIGWWFVIGFTLLVLSLLIGICVRWIRFRRSWRGDTIKKLNTLEKHLSDDNARQTVMMLSEYLRRVVLKRFSRNECAALMGESWLKWLSEHDPKEFDWQKKGRLLIEVPYAPLNKVLSSKDIKELIQATRNWVR